VVTFATSRLQTAHKWNHNLENSLVDRTFVACKLDSPTGGVSGDKWMAAFNRPWSGLTVLVTLAMLGTGPVFSKDSDQGQKDWQACMDKSDGSNAAWGGCGQVWLKQEDDKLNAVWKEIYGQSTGQTKTDILAEQRLWNAYKEGSCQVYANGIGRGTDGA
jgi:uncharacterized protein YecT (DUF1311 family)